MKGEYVVCPFGKLLIDDVMGNFARVIWKGEYFLIDLYNPPSNDPLEKSIRDEQNGQRKDSPKHCPKCGNKNIHKLPEKTNYCKKCRNKWERN